MRHPLPEALCHRWHHAFLRVRFVGPRFGFLWCDACEVLR